MSCPCGSNLEYSNCCARFLEQSQLPETPEQLMRSRYTAFTKSRVDYIENTQAEHAAKHYDRKSAEEWVENAQWLGLEILSSAQEGDTGEVEFIARYREDNQDFKAQERSEFKRIDGKWFYVGEVNSKCGCQHEPAKKVGRNDPCPCGSGKKFKKCCL